MLDEMLNDVGLMLVLVVGAGAFLITLVGAGLFVTGFLRGRKVENFDDVGQKIMKVVGVILLIIGLIGLITDGFIGAVYFVEKYILSNAAPQYPIQQPVTHQPAYPGTLLQYQWTSSMNADEVCELAAKELMDLSNKMQTDSSYQLTLIMEYATSLQKDVNMQSNVDLFLKNYPKDIKHYHLKEVAPATESAVDDASGSAKYAQKTWICEEDTETWFITVECCYENSIPDEEGILAFRLENLESRALHLEPKDYLAVIKEEATDGEKAALIGREAFLLKETDRTPATAAELKNYIDGGIRKLPELEEKMGEPQCSFAVPDAVSIDHYYELAPENNEPLYARIVTHTDGEEILEVDLLTSMEHLTDRTIYRAEKAE